MKLRLVGIQSYDFQKDGEHVKGNKLHAMNENPSMNGLVGYQVMNINCNDNMLLNLLNGDTPNHLINKTIDVEFNQYGKANSIQIVSNK